jgi:four helix bundle protein
MKTGNAIRDKSFAFALKVVWIYRYLTEERREYVMSKQLLKCGTSIGANVEEAQGAQSKRDFYSKMTIAYKEARESVYWIKLLFASNYLTEDQAQELLTDAEELCRIIGSIQVSMKRNML